MAAAVGLGRGAGPQAESRSNSESESEGRVARPDSRGPGVAGYDRDGHCGPAAGLCRRH